MFLVFLILLSKAWAFEYSIDEKNLLSPSILNAHELKNHFQTHGYESFNEVSLSKTGLPFDQVFFSFGWKKSLILKSGLKFPKEYEGKILKDHRSDLLAFHFTYNNSPYLLLALDIDTSELKTLISPWLKNDEVSWISWLISEAHADTCEVMDGSSLGTLNQTALSISENALMKSIGQCALDALHEVKENMQAKLDFFKKLATNPSQIWAETKKAFVEMKNLITIINVEMSSIFSNTKGLSQEQMTKLSCVMAGTLLATVARGLVTGPSGLLKEIPEILKKLKNSSGALRKLAESGKFKLIQDKKILAEVMSCAY